MVNRHNTLWQISFPLRYRCIVCGGRSNTRPSRSDRCSLRYSACAQTVASPNRMGGRNTIPFAGCQAGPDLLQDQSPVIGKKLHCAPQSFGILHPARHQFIMGPFPGSSGQPRPTPVPSKGEPSLCSPYPSSLYRCQVAPDGVSILSRLSMTFSVSTIRASPGARKPKRTNAKKSVLTRWLGRIVASAADTFCTSSYPENGPHLSSVLPSKS